MTCHISSRTASGLLFSCLFAAVSAQATNTSPISGADNPVFEQAVQAWLDDNDNTSLPALSRQAKDGNTAARLLIARIEATDRSPTEYLRRLRRTEWLNMFRADANGSPYAPSWLKTETLAGHALADLLLSATSLGLNPDRVHALIAAGEPQAAEHLMRKIAVDGDDAQRDALLERIPGTHELHPYLWAFRHARDGVTTGDTALQHVLDSDTSQTRINASLSLDANSNTAKAFVDIGYQGGDQMPASWPDNPYFDSIAHWVMTDPVAQPIATACNRACSGDAVPACANTAFGLYGGYYELIRLDSPVENLIPQAQFITSERAVGMVMRRVANARTEIGHHVFNDTAFATKSQCLADFAQVWKMDVPGS